MNVHAHRNGAATRDWSQTDGEPRAHRQQKPGRAVNDDFSVVSVVVLQQVPQIVAFFYGHDRDGQNADGGSEHANAGGDQRKLNGVRNDFAHFFEGGIVQSNDDMSENYGDDLMIVTLVYDHKKESK